MDVHNLWSSMFVWGFCFQRGQKDKWKCWKEVWKSVRADVGWVGEGEASGVISPNFGQSTSCLGLSLPALPRMNGGRPAFSKIFIQNAEIQPLHVYTNRTSPLEASYNYWQPIFNEQGGNCGEARWVQCGCNMFTDSGNAPGRHQIAFESATAQLCNSQLYCPNINSSL